MEIKLAKDIEQKLTGSIQRYMRENFDEEIGELKASMFLCFCLEEIAPSVYNQAISDARAFMQERVADLENVCFAQEFAHWQGWKGASRKPERRR